MINKYCMGLLTVDGCKEKMMLILIGSLYNEFRYC
jgi:hypothetical protein